MSELVRQFVVATPAGTLSTAPLHTAMRFPAANVTRIDVLIPAGNNGNLGFTINNGGGSYVPANGGSFVLGDDKFMSWEISGAPNNGNWECVSYNTGQFSHTLYIYFAVDNLKKGALSFVTDLIGL